MKTNLNAKAARFIICASMLAGTLTWGHAQAAERLGTPVWDVEQIPSAIAKSNHAYVAAYGDVLVRSNGVVILRDQTYPGKFMRVDIRQLKPLDSRRLLRSCNLKACSEIMSGFIVHGRLHAISAIPFVSGNRFAASSVSNRSDTSPSYKLPWLCHDLMCCI